MALLRERCSSFVGLFAKAARRRRKHRLLGRIASQRARQSALGDVNPGSPVRKMRDGWVPASSGMRSRRLCHWMKFRNKMYGKNSCSTAQTARSKT